MLSLLQFTCAAVVAVFLLSYSSCEPTVREGLIDEYGCEKPPPDVFTKAGVEVGFAQATFGQVVLGDVSVTVDPQVISLASKVSTDSRIRSYVSCLAIKRDDYTPEQAAYLQDCSDLMATDPTTEEWLTFKKEHPFPLGKKETSGSISVGFPENLTLRVAITILVENVEKSSVLFAKSCIDTLLGQIVKGGQIEAPNTLGIIKQLPLRLVSQGPQISFQATKNSETGIYEIECK